MTSLRLAGNLIEASGPAALGHLQLVFEASGNLVEMEVQAPGAVFAGNFVYEEIDDHTSSENTSNYDVEGEYQWIELDLDERPADAVWDILLQIHSQFQAQGTNIDYDLNQNSNTYAVTLMRMVGIEDIAFYVDGASPTAVTNSPFQDFPGSRTNLFDNPVNYDDNLINFTIIGWDDVDDKLWTGYGNDIIVGGTGSDSLAGNDGEDFLFGGNQSASGLEYIIDANGDVQLNEFPDRDPVNGYSFSDRSWDDGKSDYLEGGSGLDHYFVGASGSATNISTNIIPGDFDNPDNFDTDNRNNFNEAIYDAIDIIYDTDGQGTIWYTHDFNDWKIDNTNGGNTYEIGFLGENSFHGRPLYSLFEHDDSGSYFWDLFVIDRYTNPETGITADRLVHFSSTHGGYRANFAIDGFANGAFGITIEGYVAGPIDSLDTESTDSIDGTDGDDTINAYAGDDTVQGYAGADTIDGGVGNDTALYSQSANGVTVNLALGTASGGDAAGDVLTSIENLTGSDFADNLVGNLLANTLLGGLGNDVLNGGGGADLLDGGNGNDWAYYTTSSEAVTVNLENGTGSGGDAEGDTLISIERVYGSNHNDTFVGNAENNHIYGADGNDNFYGGLGADSLYGGNGNDIIIGEDDDDILEGGVGDDYLNGGTGEDSAYYTTSSAAVTVNLESGTGTGGDAEGDTLVSIERIYGSNHNDTLIGDGEDNRIYGADGNDSIYGGMGADRLYGGDGNDIIIGEDGNDILEGGSGDDYLDGVQGNDTFVFDGQNLGADGIGNFEINNDTIQMHASTGISNYTELQNAMTQSGVHTVINFGNSSSITMYDIDMATLDIDDFTFV